MARAEALGLIRNGNLDRPQLNRILRRQQQPECQAGDLRERAAILHDMLLHGPILIAFLEPSEQHKAQVVMDVCRRMLPQLRAAFRKSTATRDLKPLMAELARAPDLAAALRGLRDETARLLDGWTA